jgi:hypothetical protein
LQTSVGKLLQRADDVKVAIHLLQIVFYHWFFGESLRAICMIAWNLIHKCTIFWWFSVF